MFWACKTLWVNELYAADVFRIHLMGLKQWKVEKLPNSSDVMKKLTEYNKKTCVKFPKTIFWSVLMKMCSVCPINDTQFTIPYSCET